MNLGELKKIAFARALVSKLTAPGHFKSKDIYLQTDFLRLSLTGVL